MLLSVITQKSHAADNNTVSPNAVRSFQYQFGYSTEVKWAEINGLYKGEFSIGTEKHFAFYNENGELVAMARYLTLSSLPEIKRNSLLKRAKGYNITEIFEVWNDGGTTVYATFQNEKEIRVLYSSSKNWVPFKNIKK
jgi:hypothetical protein